VVVSDGLELTVAAMSTAADMPVPGGSWHIRRRRSGATFRARRLVAIGSLQGPIADLGVRTHE
jgi:hypothetical protein